MAAGASVTGVGGAAGAAVAATCSDATHKEMHTLVRASRDEVGGLGKRIGGGGCTRCVVVAVGECERGEFGGCRSAGLCRSAFDRTQRRNALTPH